MMPDLDNYRVAKLLVDQHVDEAVLYTTGRLGVIPVKARGDYCRMFRMEHRLLDPIKP
jgi:hypothetical protein